MAEEQNKPTGEHVVVVNGQRASGLMSQQEAQAEADKRKQKIAESQGQEAAEKVQVKQNLFG